MGTLRSRLRLSRIVKLPENGALIRCAHAESLGEVTWGEDCDLYWL